MSLISQIVRSSPTIANPTGIVSDILNIGKSFTGSGAPVDVPGAIANSKYTDTVSGIEYQLNDDGVWEPFFDFTTLPPPPPADPFVVNTVKCDELDVDTIRGKAGDDVDVDVGAVGNLDVIGSGGTNGIHLKTSAGGFSNIVLQGNGYASFASGIKTYDLFLDNGSGKAMKHDVTPEYKTYVTGTPSEYTIENVNAPITLSTDDLVNVKSTSTSNKFIIDPLEGTIQANGGSGMTLEATNVTQPVQIKAGATSGNVVLVAGTGGLVDIKGAASRISTQEPNTFLIDHRIEGEDIELQAAPGGAGNIRLAPGSTGEVQLTNDLNCQANKLTNVEAINGGDTLSRYGNLSVGSDGFLQYSHTNISQTFTWLQVGADTAGDYGNIGFNGAVNPADVPCIYIPWSSKINTISAALHYSGAWTFGSGSAQILIGYIPAGQATIDANFVSVYPLNITTGSNFFQLATGQLNVTLPLGKLAAKLVVSGSSSTSNTAELSCTVFVH
jgi:hypothetical protein